MKTKWTTCLPCIASTLLGLSLVVGSAAAATNPHLLVTNDDVAPTSPNSVSFYTIGNNGSLTLSQTVLTGGVGIGGGYFGMNRVNVLNGSSQQCVYASDADTSDIVGIVVSTATVGGSATGSATDTGLSNGIGLVMNSQYLYASFSDSNTIGTFAVEPGCALTFIGDTAVAGLQSGVIDAMAVHGNILIATFGDGSIESFDISGGTPVSNGDEQNSTGAVSAQGATYPTGIDITQDGHYALFGDTSTAAVVEVSDISSGKLSKTVVYQSNAGINSSNIMLSPDETLLYIVDTQGDTVSASFFDASTGKLSGGCVSGKLKGYVTDFSYLAGLALENNTGNGGGIYVAEFGAPSSIAEVAVTSSGGKCTLKEAPNSPVSDANSSGLLSIGVFPPRAF
jgi:6-phosphogluconolactonase (cycloisomerase 2 family)